MTNEKMAARLESIAVSCESVSSADADIPALRAGAQALREVDKLRAELAEEAQVHQRIRAAKNQFVKERNAALREVERLRGALHDIYSIASRAQAEPELSTGDLVDICTICEDHGGDTTDPRDARIAELEAALRGIWDLREKTERTYEDAYKSMFKSRGEAEWDAVDAALKEGGDATR